MKSHRLLPGPLWSVLGLVCALILAGAPCAVAGVFYQWSDDDGVVHLTDDPAKIPKDFRDEAQEIRLPDEPSRPEPPPARTPESPAETGKPAGDVDLQGHDRPWWERRMQEWRNRKAEAEGKLVDARARLRRERFLDSNVGSYQRQQEILDEISAYEKQISEADRMLTNELPEDARRAGAPPGWLRE